MIEWHPTMTSCLRTHAHIHRSMLKHKATKGGGWRAIREIKSIQMILGQIEAVPHGLWLPQTLTVQQHRPISAATWGQSELTNPPQSLCNPDQCSTHLFFSKSTLDGKYAATGTQRRPTPAFLPGSTFPSRGSSLSSEKSMRKSRSNQQYSLEMLYNRPCLFW